MRVGIGYDVHPLGENRKLVLGGVEISYSRGLIGYSDGDVLVHSIMDALLGACGLGDIGIHFPDNDAKYKGISSLILLKEVRKKMEGEGFSIINIDSILIMEKPKVSSYIPLMKRNIAQILGIDEKVVNIKATTTEGLGFCGREEGIAAQSVVLLE
ncbi:MAG: 2-C-methyl-D-erythritol 2,4-cyclodiphosphate synthase [Actinobacteria bacterium]|nr:2-C-methyl-D-erythritol 2,4-cyclodiphosphate synthase [Actinomycetota bacterium]